MYKKISIFKYLLLLVFFKSNLFAQKPDSLPFKLKPFFVGVELGKSPKLNLISPDYPFNGYPSFTQKYLPCYTFNLGYNIRIYKSSFLTVKIGYSLLQYEYNLKDENTYTSKSKQTVGPQTTYIQTTVSELFAEKVKIINNNALLTLDYQKYYSPFKNNKIKLFLSGGTFLKVRINTKYDYSSTYRKDSLFYSFGSGNSISTHTNLKDQSGNYYDTRKWRAFTPYLLMGSGLLFNNKYVQHKVGLLLNIRLSVETDTPIEQESNYLNLNVFYSINF